ncbi:membrane-bound serine protease (ClpP class) [Texcoconibacillus texcoconensis]|uniref:Membrane-bound serine protease (ClpP class) n=1 Tax=Texcoconibacillus texcoconensis TaxID=1095777 RepID=A0A840QRJ1_9BACI|nr:nodulation protein NfeD [Texcoconibacillus texcoconensis]MBB5173943.1 membrane-bound serine protease (ClpP class) [Texcoconibacillus texcoconensis]
MQKGNIRTVFYSFLIALSFVLSVFQPSAYSNSEGQEVFYIPVEQEVERGLGAFLERGIETAVESGADHIVLEINTPGGLVDAAGEIASLVRNSPLPITAYVVHEAMSAGAYIALNADDIVMKPGTQMGSAQVIDGSGTAAEDKMHSSWLATMENSAELNDRDPIYARAMADSTVDLPKYRAGEGNLLTLKAGEAFEVGYAEAIAEDRKELLEYLGLEGAEEREMEVTFAEQLARFVTNPVVIPILLSIGSIGLVLELYSPGFGVPGIMGASSLILYFAGHLIAGFAGWETFILFALGIVLLGIEILVPGFGIFGLLGAGSLIGSMVLASFSTVNIIISIMIAAVLTIIVSILFFKYVGYRGPLKHVVLTDSTKSELGYVSSETRSELVGQVGTVLTPLRPAGAALFGEERLDVVSEGGYIEQGKKVKVVSTSGSRIVVREVKDEQND